ncbi:hypothetical protein [Jiangella asiatica]|uniref:Uncharacterized protein n=1 Tax=Jiangella asiatica TaxID=2530372 RepID=A0A4R5CLR5_9ACTN|nr:hypothetical protein [Jiangella asiatica]TDE01292.1 hypothetical protein E1269_23305 [Jiangella asiatica]
MPLVAWGAARAFTSSDADSGDGASASTESDRGASEAADSGSDGASDDPTTDANSYEIAALAQDAIDACAARLAAGEQLVAVAEVGIGHWNEHVQARTDMLAGTIGQEEMRAIWKRTRLAGADDVSRANAALDAYRAHPDCAGLADLEASDGMVEQAQECMERSASVDAAVTAATAAMGDWANHLNAMVAHANGDMNGLEAQDAWVAAWTAAPTNIGGFNNARDQLALAPSCG